MFIGTMKLNLFKSHTFTHTKQNIFDTQQRNFLRTPLYYVVILLLIVIVNGCSNSANNPDSQRQAVNKIQKHVTSKNLYGVEAFGDKYAWVVGEEGTIFHTSDKGENWETQKSPVNFDLYEASFVDSNTGWIVGKRGTILHTTDGGNLWTVQETNTKERLFAVHFIDKNKGWAVGTMTTIMNTVDGGHTWVNQGPGEDRYLNGVLFINDRIGWVVGEYNTIYHTTNGGKQWVLQECEVLIPEEPEKDFPPPPPHLFGIYFLNQSVGCVASMDGIIVRTEDGGIVWEKIETSARFTFFNIAMVKNMGWAVGERGQFCKTTDSGKSWKMEKDVIKTRFWLRDIDFPDIKNGWIVGAFGTILHTEDSGRTWDMISGISIQ